MNRIVKEHYPATRLPEDLREGLDPGDDVRVTVEIVSSPKAKTDAFDVANWVQRPEPALSLDEIFALRRPPFKSTEEIERELRRERDAWDD